jgi:hypothetical protein
VGVDVARPDVRSLPRKPAHSLTRRRSLVIYSRLVVAPGALYALGLASSFASYTLHVASLDPRTGALLASAHVPSSLAAGPESFMPLADSIAWLEGGALRTVALSPDLAGIRAVRTGEKDYAQIVDVGLGDLLVGVRTDGTGVVLRPDGHALWEFADSVRAPFI